MRRNTFSRLFIILIFAFACFGSAAGQFDFSEYDASENPSVIDLLRERDENLVVIEHDGKVTWISGDLTDTVVTDDDSAWEALGELIFALGADENTEYKPDVILEDDSGYVYYTYMQFYNSVSIIDSVVKLIVNPQGRVEAITGNVTSLDPELYDFEQSVDENTALMIAMDYVKENDPYHRYVFLDSMDSAFLTIDVDDIDESPVGNSTKFFYIFYSNNPEASNDKHDMPMLAHYVTMHGVYAGSQPCAYVGDKNAMTASDAETVFEGMTPAVWTGKVTDHNGNIREITLPVMRDANGVTWLGDLERKIVVAECADLMQDSTMKESMLNSGRNADWPNKVLMAYENYIRVWDFYNELGWQGPDGMGSPMVILNNYVDSDLQPVDNAVYMGFNEGFHLFATSELNDYCEALDVIGHEFTHAVTSTAMTRNLYINEYGAINEAMSDIMGNIIEYSLGMTNDKEWLLGENSGDVVRSMSDPNAYQQPAYVGDQYWVPKTDGYNEEMDYGGVHINSGLLNTVAYRLYQAGMTIDELCDLFSGVICGLIPTTGNAEMSELLLFSLKISGLERYNDLVRKVCEEIGFGINANVLLRVPEGCGRLVMYVPDTAAIDRGEATLVTVNIAEAFMNMMLGGDLDLDDLDGMDEDDAAGTLLLMNMMKSARTTWADSETGLIVTTLPEGDYTLMFMLDSDSGDGASAVLDGSRWVSSDAEDSGSGSGSSFVHIQAGCETWVSSAGLDTAFNAR